MGWNHRRCISLTIPVLNYLLLKVIVPAARMKTMANVLRLSLSHRPCEGYSECLSLFDFRI